MVEVMSKRERKRIARGFGDSPVKYGTHPRPNSGDALGLRFKVIPPQRGPLTLDDLIRERTELDAWEDEHLEPHHRTGRPTT